MLAGADIVPLLVAAQDHVMIVAANRFPCGRIAIRGICGKMKNLRMKRICWPLVVLAAALLGLAWHASLHVSPGPAMGTAFDGEFAPLAATKTTNERLATIRLGAFNIHGGKGRDGRRDLDRVADNLRDLDFVALNEVLGQTIVGGPDQAELLARQLDMRWLFAPADQRWFYAQSGNGVLSRLPVRSWQRLPLPRRYDRSHRNMVLVDVPCGADVPSGIAGGDTSHRGVGAYRSCTVHLLLTHVNHRYKAEREAQLAAAIALYLALAEPAVLLGDLNSEADDPQIRRLLQMPGVVDAVGEKLGDRDSPGRIDWIIVRGLRPVEAGVRDNGASDHPLVWAELELPAEKSPL